MTKEMLFEYIGAEPSPELLALAEAENQAWIRYQAVETAEKEAWRKARKLMDQLKERERLAVERERLRAQILKEIQDTKKP